MKGICFLNEKIDELNFSAETENGKALPITFKQGEKYKFGSDDSRVYVCFSDNEEYFVGFSYRDFGKVFCIERLEAECNECGRIGKDGPEDTEVLQG